MSLSRRVVASWTAVAGAAILSAISIPQEARAQPVGLRMPQFRVTAVSFKALDETGWDWTGSDEVLAVFSDLDPTHTDRLTSIYGDVDAGETHAFNAADTCIAPQPKCDRGVASVHFKMALWENDDTGFLHGELTGGHNRLEHGAYWGDDLIGRAEVAKSSQDLVADLPSVGSHRDYTIRPAGGAGAYEFTYRITRLPNAFRIPPIGPPVSLTISLQATAATAGNGARVTLTWSGATTDPVDIYRDNAKIATTPNDGSYMDAVPHGTYRYRVCNLGSTTCSADVDITA